MIAHQVAQILLDIGAFGLTLDNPITFKSGILSPVYTDNRFLPFHPAQWRVIIEGFHTIIHEKNIPVDVIAGIEAAGIPHSAALGFSMQIPSVFVRKEAKAHGKKNRVEGGQVEGRRVLLVEDLITTGGSSLSGVQALREAGAIVDHCFAITSYEFAEAAENFAAASVTLHTLTSFSAIWEVLKNSGKLRENEIAAVESWKNDPHHWSKP